MACPLEPVLQTQNLLALLCLLSCSVSLAVRVITPVNLTVQLGQPTTLSCELDIKTHVLQIEWSRCKKPPLLVFHSTSGLNADDNYKDRISEVSISRFTIKETTMNDSGAYCCVLTTYPHGTHKGHVNLFLHKSYEPPDSSSFSTTTTIILPIIGAVLVLMLLAGVTAGVLHQKRKGSIRNPVHVVVHSRGFPTHKPSFLQRTTTVQSPSNNRPCQESQEHELHEKNEEYFNVVSKP